MGGMEREMGGRFKGEGIDVHLWLDGTGVMGQDFLGLAILQ